MSPGALSIEVVMCTYNGAAFLRPQIESILGQSRPVQRLSIYDDGSTDETMALLRQLADAAPPGGPVISIQRNPANLGYARNFAQAIGHAREDLLVLCDQDDIWDPDKIAVLAGLLEDGPADLAFSDGTPVDAQDRELAGPSVLQSYGLGPDDIEQFGREAATRLARRNYVNGAACAVRRSAAQAALPVPAGLPHDYWLAIWAATHGGIVASPRRLYRYRQHGRNVIGIGRQPLHWQLAAIWGNPQAPRLRELAYCNAIVQRLDGLPGPYMGHMKRKQAWLQACVHADSRLQRLRAVLGGLLRRDYRDFATPYALLRDVVAIVRHPQ